jgi:hypothetical protein
MSWFSGLVSQSSKESESGFGYNIDKKNTVTDMHNMQKKMEKTTTKYIGELDKYKEIAKFNKQLTKSYIANLDIIVDVSKVLNMYMETIEVIRTQIERAEQALGKPLDAQDLAYLAEITKENISKLSQNFLTETTKLQGLFAKNPDYRNEQAKVFNAQAEFKSSMTQMADTYKKESAILTAEAARAAASGQVPQPQQTLQPLVIRGGKTKTKNSKRKQTKKKST